MSALPAAARRRHRTRNKEWTVALHATALKPGGTDEGAPGLRSPEGPQAFYGAYFRDPEGNKFCAFRTGPA
jgi:hypothetical protein